MNFLPIIALGCAILSFVPVFGRAPLLTVAVILLSVYLLTRP